MKIEADVESIRAPKEWGGSDGRNKEEAGREGGRVHAARLPE
jgi:hypothetical protein